MNRLNRMMEMIGSEESGTPYWGIALAVRCPHNSYHWKENRYVGCNTCLTDPKEWWNGYRGEGGKAP